MNFSRGKKPGLAGSEGEGRKGPQTTFPRRRPSEIASLGGRNWAPRLVLPSQTCCRTPKNFSLSLPLRPSIFFGKFHATKSGRFGGGELQKEGTLLPEKKS